MSTVFFKILVIFMMAATGFAANKTGVLPHKSNKYLIALLLQITMPCMVIDAVAAKSIEEDTATQIYQVLAGAFIFFLFASIFSFLFLKLIKYKPKKDIGVLIVMMASVNTGFMGFPVTQSIFGDDCFFLMVIQNIVLCIYAFCVSGYIMSPQSLKEGGGKEHISALLSPCNIASAVGLAILFSGVTMPEFLQDFFGTVGKATTPISMIVVGIELAESDLKKMFTNVKLLVSALVSVTVIPALTFLATLPLPLHDNVKITLVFAAAFPTAVATVGIAADKKANTSLMAEGIALTTALSIISLPITAMLLIQYFGI